jgi:NAD(P)-dependent dehydrogenase (short-subunit alcohol dehydrogenase family)
MLLSGKNAVIYGAGGAIGRAMAHAFAREGARVFLTARTAAGQQPVADDIRARGGAVDVAEVDALDEQAVETHLAAVDQAGGIDISFNAIGIPQDGIQGIPLVELPAGSFALPIASYTRAHFLTARGAARRMVKKGSGVVLMHTPEPGRIGAPLAGGMGPAWAAMEALCRGLSSEVASHGVRVICMRTTGIPETHTIDVVFGAHAKTLGITREQFQKTIEGMTHTRRSTTLAELANVATFLASDLASGMTGTVVNLTGGEVVD